MDIKPGHLTPQQRQGLVRTAFIELIRHLQPELVCDIGSFDGKDALAFRKAAPNADIIAFEASLENYTEAVQGAPFAKERIVWTYLALGDRDTAIPFYSNIVHPDEPRWRRGINSVLPRPDLETNVNRIAMRTLDGFLSEHGLINATKALWIDVEGAASLVLNGAQQSLKSAQILKVELESHEFWTDQKTSECVEDMLHDLKFVQIMSSRDDTVQQFDILFATKDIETSCRDIITNTMSEL